MRLFFRKILAFLAWMAAFLGGSTFYYATCNMDDGALYIDVPGFYISGDCDDHEDCDD